MHHLIIVGILTSVVWVAEDAHLSQAGTAVAGPETCQCEGRIVAERRDVLDRIAAQSVDTDGDGISNCFLEFEYLPGALDQVTRVFFDQDRTDDDFESVCNLSSPCSIELLASCSAEVDRNVPIIETLSRWSESELCRETGGEWHIDLASFCDFGEGMGDCPPMCLCDEGQDFAAGIGCVPDGE